uniref:Dynein light intermediate chain n=1 Tax=Daphnia galeata TaxID=27404 RepID=A0A8J2RFC4_9CRUS|nr:unnamed protein product [Daphnia galeata]
MATASDRSRTAAQMKDEKKDGNEKENIWASVLSEVQLKGTNKLSPNQQVVVIGDRESGKTTLVAKLQGNVDPKKGSGLEYAYIDVRDEYRDDHTHLAVWLLDGDASHAHLLRYALTEETYSSTLVMLTVSMTTPWAMLDQLQEWASLLQDHIDKLPFSAEAIREYQHKYVRRWQEYVEPGDELETAQLRRTSRHVDGEEEGMDHLLPLPEGVLTRNLGLDIVVVVTKTDYMATLEKDLDYKEEHFDFIQEHLRKFCLQYGAALFYTSVKEDKNCDLLYKYLVHRIYGLVFPTPALVVEKDAVFIPAGWDNDKKIAILYENLQSMKPDDDYSDVINRPTARKPAPREAELHAEDEQNFLSRLLQQLQQQQPAPVGVTGAVNGSTASPTPAGTGVNSPSAGTPIRSGIQVQKPVDRRSSSSAIPNQMDPTKTGITGTSEGVLANFFNSLLKKSSSTASPTGMLQAGDRVSVPNSGAPTSGSEGSPVPGSPDKLNLVSRPGEVAAELDRLAQSASSRLNPIPSVPVSTNVDNSSSDC